MAIIDKMNLETRFQLNTTPNEIIKLTDTTDWASEGVDPADVTGAFVITSPIGTVFHITTLPAFDIDLSVQDYIDTIVLPTDSNGDVLKGVYTVDYSIAISDAVPRPVSYTKSFTYNYCYEAIDVKVGISVNLIDSKLTSTDNTSYPIQLTSSTRTHEIHPPAGLDATDYPVSTVSTITNIYSPITTKTWTGKVTNILTLTYSASDSFSQHIIEVTVTGNSEKDIKDDINICNLQCNMRSLTKRYSDALQYNPIDAVAIQQQQVVPAMINAFMYTSNIQCGNFDLAESYYQEVLKFTGSQPDCECSDSDTPTLIHSSGGGGNGGTYVVGVCNTNSALSVTSATDGDETTYTVCFDNVIWEKITALTETNLTSIDGSVTIAAAINGYVKTYNLSVSTTSPSIFSGIIDIDLSDKSVVPSMSFRSGWSTISGLNIIEPSIVNDNDASLASWIGSSNCFYLENYHNTEDGKKPKPLMQIVEVTAIGSVIDPCKDPRSFTSEIAEIDIVRNRIYFNIKRFNNTFSSSGSELYRDFDKISISVIINA